MIPAALRVLDLPGTNVFEKKTKRYNNRVQSLQMQAEEAILKDEGSRPH
jgi:hypothetical protein